MLRFAASLLPVFAFLVVTAGPASHAMGSELGVTLTALKRVSDGERTDFRAGDVIEVGFEVTNRSDGQIALRRIVLQSEPAISLVAPDSDGLDNDADGAVDEDDEAFSRREPSGAIWRFLEGSDPLDPGQTISRRVRLQIGPEIAPGTDTGLTISIGGSRLSTTRPEPRRGRLFVPLPLRPPALEIALSDGGKHSTSDPARIEILLHVPVGRFDDVALTVDVPPALAALEAGPIKLGEGFACEVNPAPRVTVDRFVWQPGRCVVTGAAEGIDAELRLTFSGTLIDADPWDGADEIAAHRKPRLQVTFTDGEETLVRAEAQGRISGPLLATQLLAKSTSDTEPGSTVVARYQVRNVGDEPLERPIVTLGNTRTFECVRDLATLSTCEQDFPLDTSLGPGEGRELDVAAPLRDDAELSTPPRLALLLRDAAGRRFDLPEAEYPLKPPLAPQLDLLDPVEWRADSNILHATIGERGRLRLSGTLPAGRYDGEIRLLARAVRAQTGEPLGPVAMNTANATLTLGEGEAGPIEMETRQTDAWAMHTVPVKPSEAGNVARVWTLDLDAILNDFRPVRRGVIVELTAEMRSYGAMLSGGTDWLEVLVHEPEIRLKLLAADNDRTLLPREPIRLVALACNYGDAVAHDVLPLLELPDYLLAASATVNAVRLPRLGLQDASTALEAIAAGNTGNTAMELLPQGNLLRVIPEPEAGLDPEMCIAVELTLPRRKLPSAPKATEQVDFRVDPYRGGPHSAARIYPAVEAIPLVFRSSVLQLQASSRAALDGEGRVRHRLTLRLPSEQESVRLAMVTQSYGTMGWSARYVDADGREHPWRDGLNLRRGEEIVLLFEGRAPEKRTLGWTDTTSVQLTAIDEGGRSFVANARLITEDQRQFANAVASTRSVALDRDCDGELADEHIQDAIFEPVKDAQVGDCIVFRIAFENVGDTMLELITIRHRVSDLTTLVADSIAVSREPEKLNAVDPVLPTSGNPVIAWNFRGLFEPGAEGEVTYAVRLQRNPRAPVP